MLVDQLYSLPTAVTPFPMLNLWISGGYYPCSFTIDFQKVHTFRVKNTIYFQIRSERRFLYVNRLINRLQKSRFHRSQKTIECQFFLSSEKCDL